MSDDLNDDEYLWSGTGTPDPEVARLESLLGRYRHQGAMPLLPIVWSVAAWCRWP